MNACTNPNCRRIPLKVTFDRPFDRDERLPMVERVLGLLVESRHGLDRKAELLSEFWNDHPVMREVPDLFPQPFPVPDCVSRIWSLFNSIAREQEGPRQSGRRACHRGLLAGIPLQTSPSTLGRGSPLTKRAGASPPSRLQVAEQSYLLNLTSTSIFENKKPADSPEGGLAPAWKSTDFPLGETRLIFTRPILFNSK